MHCMLESNASINLPSVQEEKRGIENVYLHAEN